MNLADRQSELAVLLEALFRGELSRTQADRLASLEPEAARLAWLAANARFAQLQQPPPPQQQQQQQRTAEPSTPSGMVPPHEKPAAKRRRKKPGAREGHAGSRRKTPEKIDARVEHRLEVCPCCGGPVQRCKRTRTRIIEDIPQDIRPVVTEHTIHRDYCPACRKHVEPVVPDAMPNATLGHNAWSRCRAGSTTAWA